MKTIILTFLYTLIFIAVTQAKENKFALFYPKVFSMLEAVPDLEKEYPLDDKKNLIKLRKLVIKGDEVETAKALILLWRAGEGHYVMRQWWSSEDPFIRTTVAMLLFSQPVGGTILQAVHDTWKGYANRLKEKDAKQRVKELRYAEAILGIMEKKKPEMFNILRGTKEKSIFYSHSY